MERNMTKLNLTQEQADHLIDLFKDFVNREKIDLSVKHHGKINLKSNDLKHNFNLYYMFALNNHHIVLNDAKTNLTLIKINIDSKFHKNSDGKIYGHRVEIFNEEEFYKKKDGFTHYKAFQLPYKSIANTDDFLEALQSFFNYANIEKERIKLFKNTKQLKLDI